MSEPRGRDPDLGAWRAAYARMQNEGSPSCPSEQRLAGLALGELDGTARSELTDHLVSCRRCSSAMKDLLELHRESEREIARTPQPGWRRRRIAATAAAAAFVILLIGIPLLLRQHDRLPTAAPSFPRGPAAPAARIEPEDRATLTAVPDRLRWPKDDGADGYQVVLYDAESTPIWESPVIVEPEIELPDSVRTPLAAGGDYYWRVTTFAGVDRRSSPLHRFHLAP